MEEKFNNKTCGECKHYYNDCGATSPDIIADYCEDFEQKKKLTIGDCIRQMSDEELANWGMYDLGTCPTFEKHQTCPKFRDCSASEIEQCWLNWLKQKTKDEADEDDK